MGGAEVGVADVGWVVLVLVVGSVPDSLLHAAPARKTAETLATVGNTFVKTKLRRN